LILKQGVLKIGKKTQFASLLDGRDDDFSKLMTTDLELAYL
jgi:hypothetical protein